MTGLARFGVLLALCASLVLADPHLEYSKYFKGSVPEFVLITVSQDGQVTYQEDKQDDNPIRVQLSAADTSQLFDLAAKLDHFQHPIESGLKVANMGEKTFRFVDDAQKHEVEFNYSQDLNAQALLNWFERIATSERNLINLDRTVHYDKLGVNDAILQIEIAWDHNELVAPEQFLTLLDRVIKNESYLHMARERAAELADTIRKGPAPSAKAQQ